MAEKPRILPVDPMEVNHQAAEDDDGVRTVDHDEARDEQSTNDSEEAAQRGRTA